MLQAIETHTTNPAPANPQAGLLPLHFIECASRPGPYWTERAGQETSRDRVIADLTCGAVEGVRVICVDLAAGRSWDVSADIALEVLRRCEDRGDICREAMDFCERHLTHGQIMAAWRLAKVA